MNIFYFEWKDSTSNKWSINAELSNVYITVHVAFNFQTENGKALRLSINGLILVISEWQKMLCAFFCCCLHSLHWLGAQFSQSEISEAVTIFPVQVICTPLVYWLYDLGPLKPSN